MTFRWFFSKSVRRATELRNHVRKLYNAQGDILSPEASAGLETALESTNRVIHDGADSARIETQLQDLENVANERLKPYPNAEWRENIEVFLVAIAVAMAIRTFFVQPFKIPTGSMQPTLFGITYENLLPHPEVLIPGLLGRIKDACIHGVFYHALVARDNGEIIEIPRKETFLRFINLQRLVVRYAGAGGDRTETHTLWFAPEEKFESYADVHPGQAFYKGDYIVKLREITGDHLFVDRVTYNFRHPKRGEIVVFQTKGIDDLPQDQFYIKRLVALGGETVQIGGDRHLIIDGQRLDAATPHFESVYSFTGPPGMNKYSGHVNLDRRAVFFFPDRSYQVRPRHLMVMGDNTMNSSDSRYWGDFPEENVIGKSFFIYWPISNHGTSRFGWSVR